jgi:hypothetical protein
MFVVSVRLSAYKCRQTLNCFSVNLIQDGHKIKTKKYIIFRENPLNIYNYLLHVSALLGHCQGAVIAGVRTGKI